MKKIFGIILVLLLLAGLALLDRWVTRDDRMAYDAAQRDILKVADQILRYRSEKGKLPARLMDLVPLYLPEASLKKEGKMLYDYDPQAGYLRRADPFRIRGLISRNWPAIERSLPLEPPPAISQAEKPKPPPVPKENLAALYYPEGEGAQAAPDGAFVFEAEHFSEMNWGWQLAGDKAASGGAYIHSLEGTSNEPAQISYGIFDFHNIEEKNEISILRYRFHIPESGKYYLYGRLWTTNSHCSNQVFVSVDETCKSNYGRYNGVSLGNKNPFQWLWSPAGYRSFYLEQGDHYLEVFMHEDGLKIDQFMFSPTRLSDAELKLTFKENLKAGELQSWQAKAAVDMHFDYKTAVFTKTKMPQVNLVFRKHKAIQGMAKLRLSFDGSLLQEQKLDLDKLKEVSFLKIDFSKLKGRDFARREYLLEAKLLQDEKVIAACHRPFVHPMQWEVSPKGRYLHGSNPGRFDGDKNSEDQYWQPLKETSFDHFGLLDFGLHTTKNSLYPPTWASIYARTEIDVKQSATYLLKIQADDELMLWVDGERVLFHNRSGPVTRSVRRLKLKLEKGKHRIRLRVCQRDNTGHGDGRWQASLRFRTTDDKLTDICGVNAQPANAGN